MFTRRDHFSDASQTNAATQLDLHAACSNALLEGAQKFLELHMQVTQTAFREMESLAGKIISAQSLQEYGSLAFAQAAGSSKKSMAYACHVTGIVAGTQSELIDLFGSQVSDTNTEAIALIVDVSRNTPMGFNRIVNFMRVVLDHANAGCEQASQLSKQVLDALENSLIAAARQLARTA